jgi:hydrogenase maturation protein HypF
LFDAAAVLLGGRPTVTYEAQAAIELEWCTRGVDRAEVGGAGFAGLAPVECIAGSFVLDPAPLLARLIADRAAGVPAAPLAAAFHEEIGRASASLAAEVARARGIGVVVLTGGVFQNARLTEIVEGELVNRGLRTLVHERVPPNDGGLSIGQAAIAALGG